MQLHALREQASPRIGRSGGVEGNARLTGSAAALLLVLLAAEGATLLSVGRLLRPHVFIGFALIPLVTLKAGSTIYRFARYYSGSRPYRRKGPPPALLRLLGPVLILATVSLLASGVGLMFTHGVWLGRLLTLHKASFIVWFAATTLHVVGHLLDTAKLAPRDWMSAPSGPATPTASVAGAAVRRWTIALGVAAGAILGAWSLGHLGVWITR
ncbi:MAG: hypothetical protein ACRDNS_26210, partial [Trebonia sp.]